MSFAADTSVSVEKSKAEIDSLLRKHGAAQRGIVDDDDAGRAIVYFRIADRQVRLQVPLPRYEQTAFYIHKQRGKTARTPEQHRLAHEQACRSRWRAICLVVKAKLELVEIGMSTVQREFLADITLPDGRSVAEWLKPGLEKAYMDGSMPPLLLGSGDDP